MGMGEPMLNYDNMVESIRVMRDQQALGLSKRHITISTSGVADKIRQLVDDGIDVRLALSLHAPNQELRKKLIPMIARRRDIDELMETIDRYTHMTDTPEIADELGRLLKHRNAHVNLIPYNENPAMPDLETSEYDDILSFKKGVEAHDVTVTVRDTLGRDVKGACGQLGYEVIMKRRIDDMTDDQQ